MSPLRKVRVTRSDGAKWDGDKWVPRTIPESKLTIPEIPEMPDAFK